MRKLIYFVAASLDGYLARPDGSVDWLPVPAPQPNCGGTSFLERVDELIIGRKTYEQTLALGTWPYGERRCHVLSRRWAGQRDVHADFTDSGAAALLRRIRKRPGRDIWLVGGGESAQACFAAGVVDEIILIVVPILLGEGRPMFLPRAATTPLRLRGTIPLPDGRVQLHYELRPPVPTRRRSVPAHASVASSGSHQAHTAAASASRLE